MADSRRLLLTAAGVFLLAFILRLLLLSQLADTPFFLNLFSDSRIYATLARAIVDGSGIPTAYFMSPLYPYLLAAVDVVTGDMLLWTRILQSVLGAGTAVLMLYAGRLSSGFAGGIVAGVLAAVYPPFLFYDTSILIESLLTFLIAAQALLLVRTLAAPSLRGVVGAGALMGLAIVSRASTALFLPVLAVLIWRWRASLGLDWRRAIAAYVLAAAVMVLPATVHNYAKEGVFIPVTASGGFNFYAGNNAEASGSYKMPEDVDLYTDLNGKRFVERMSGREMNSAEVSSWWADKAWSWITSAPGDAITLFGKKALLFAHPEEDDQLGLSMAFFREHYQTLLDLPLPGFPVLLLLALLGFFFGLRGNRMLQLDLAFLVSMVLSTAVFFVNGRLRVPFAPLLMIAAAAAAQRLFDAYRAGEVRMLLKPALGAVALFAALLLLQPAIPQQFSMEYNKLGEVAFEKGDYAGAEKYFRASLNERSTAFGHVNLGNALAASGQLAKAGEQYAAALEQDSTNALGWFNLGNLAMQAGRPGAALGYWTKAVQYQPDLAAAHRNLGLLLMQGGRPQEALEHLEQYLSLEPDQRKREEILRDVSVLRQHLGE